VYLIKKIKIRDVHKRELINLQLEPIICQRYIFTKLLVKYHIREMTTTKNISKRMNLDNIRNYFTSYRQYIKMKGMDNKKAAIILSYYSNIVRKIDETDGYILMKNPIPSESKQLSYSYNYGDNNTFVEKSLLDNYLIYLKENKVRGTIEILLHITKDDLLIIQNIINKNEIKRIFKIEEIGYVKKLNGIIDEYNNYMGIDKRSKGIKYRLGRELNFKKNVYSRFSKIKHKLEDELAEINDSEYKNIFRMSGDYSSEYIDNL
jgi:hypothetical protein